MSMHLLNMHIAGVDGCHGGWLCVEQIENKVRSRVFKSFSELINGLMAASIIAIDVPAS
jgi:hypothetical protein